MTTYRRGDVVLVPFPFSDLSGTKRRPALIVSGEGFNTSPDVIIAQITSNLETRRQAGDYEVSDWQGAGLLYPSLVRSRVTTLEHRLVVRVLGRMPAAEMVEVDTALREALGL
jgi:mRNA interferase MazF